MIDFRYHIVSIIAVFLALGIGIIVGSTVLDRAIVSGLESQLDRLNASVKEERADRRAAEDEVEAWTRFAEEGEPWLLGGSLVDRNVVMVAPVGIERSEVTDLAGTLRDQGASVPGIVWLTPEMGLESDEEREAVADALGVADPDSETLPDALVANLAVKFGVDTLPQEAQGLVAPGRQEGLLGALLQAGVVEYEPVDVAADAIETIGAPGTQVLVYGADDTAVSVDDVLVPLTEILAVGGVAVAVQSTADEQAYMTALRGSPIVRARMSTVDNVDTDKGVYSAVVGLAVAPDGVYAQMGPDTRYFPDSVQ